MACSMAGSGIEFASYHCAAPACSRARGPAPADSAPTYEQLAEQVVVAVPLAATVERDHQEVAALQLLEDVRPIRSADDRVAERTAHAVEDRRAGEEGNIGLRHPVQELGTKVIADEPIVTGDREPGRVPELPARIANAAR